MTQQNFDSLFHSFPTILGEGAVIERLRRNPHIKLDDSLVNSALIYDEQSRQALETIIRQYVDIGKRYDLPILLSTPTWRANSQRIQDAGYGNKNVNRDNALFLHTIKKSYGSYAEKIFICGLMSCRGDAYMPEERLCMEEAEEFHAWQATQLANTDIDFFLASTLPSLEEAKGIAAAMAKTSKPYIISFVLRPDGTLLDGNTLNNGIREIDTTIKPKPLAYLINCTHSSTFTTGITHPQHSSEATRTRVIGLLANTSALSPEELNNSKKLLEEEPELFGESMSTLHREMGLKIVGGCCGTDERHIEHLAQRLKDQR